MGTREYDVIKRCERCRKQRTCVLIPLTGRWAIFRGVHWHGEIIAGFNLLADTCSFEYRLVIALIIACLLCQACSIYVVQAIFNLGDATRRNYPVISLLSDARNTLVNRWTADWRQFEIMVCHCPIIILYNHVIQFN